MPSNYVLLLTWCCPSPLHLWIPAAAILAVSLLAKATSAWTGWALIYTNLPPRRVLAHYFLARRIHRYLGWLAVAVVLLACEWIDSYSASTSSISVRAMHWILLIASLTLPWMLSWAAFYDVERHLSEPRRTRSCPFHSRWRYVFEQARVHFGLAVLPLILVLLCAETLRYLAPPRATALEAWWTYACGIGLLIVLFPSLLVRVWPTTSLASTATAVRLHAFARRQGAAAEAIRVWHTGGRVRNAIVIGAIWPWRYVLISDGLLTHLTPREVQAVYAHELGHIRQQHALLRWLWIVAPVVVCFLAKWALDPFPRASLGMERMEALSSQSVLWGIAWNAVRLIPVGVVVVYLIFGTGRLSYWLEHQADAWAVERLEREWGLGEAQRVYRNMLSKLAAGCDARASWLHPSLSDRLARLQAVEAVGGAPPGMKVEHLERKPVRN